MMAATETLMPAARKPTFVQRVERLRAHLDGGAGQQVIHLDPLGFGQIARTASAALSTPCR